MPRLIQGYYASSSEWPCLALGCSVAPRQANVVHSILHIVAISTRTAAPAPSTAAASPVVVSRASLGNRRWAHEGKVDIDFLLEQLLTIGTLDGGFGIVEGRVFDEDVALQQY
jgi:hypothetical protein